MAQLTQTALEHSEVLNEGVTIWGFSLGTGYPWYIELVITLLVLGLSYGAKCYLDNWFHKRKIKRILKRDALTAAQLAKLKEK